MQERRLAQPRQKTVLARQGVDNFYGWVAAISVVTTELL
jgi:hypothetical protein